MADNHVVLAGDGGIGRPMAVVARSVARTHAGVVDVDIIVLDAGLSAEQRATVRRAAAPLDVEFLELSPSMGTGFPERMPRGMFARLYIGELLPSSVHRVVYLDTDVLVREPLVELFDLDLADEAIAASPMSDTHRTMGGDLPIRAYKEPYEGSLWEAHGLPRSSLVFNSGVLVIDVDSWRAADVANRSVAMSKDFQHGDQRYLNVIFHGRWFPLPRRFNSKQRDAAIVHFAGPVKPWHEGYYANRLLLQYREVAAETGWLLEHPRTTLAMAATRGAVEDGLHLVRARRASGPRGDRTSWA